MIMSDNYQGSTADKRDTAEREWSSPSTQQPTRPKPCSHKWPSHKTEPEQLLPSPVVQQLPQHPQLLLPQLHPLHQLLHLHPLPLPARWFQVLELSALAVNAPAHASAVSLHSPALLFKVSAVMAACQVSASTSHPLTHLL